MHEADLINGDKKCETSQGPVNEKPATVFAMFTAQRRMMAYRKSQKYKTKSDCGKIMTFFHTDFLIKGKCVVYINAVFTILINVIVFYPLRTRTDTRNMFIPAINFRVENMI